MLTGGCLCGKVRYRADVEPATTAICHCTNCQRQSGSAFSVNVMLPEASLEIEGTLSTFIDKGDSGNTVDRKFCPACGSPIFSDPAAMPGIIGLKAGTLDDHSAIKPGLQVYRDSGQEWCELAGINEFPKGFPAS